MYTVGYSPVHQVPEKSFKSAEMLSFTTFTLYASGIFIEMLQTLGCLTIALVQGTVCWLNSKLHWQKTSCADGYFAPMEHCRPLLTGVVGDSISFHGLLSHYS